MSKEQPDPGDPLFVVASSYRAFVDWCHRRGHTANVAGLRYVSDARTLNGQSNVRILFTHGWTEHPHSRAIYNRALIVGRRPS
jgi:hypothetical protein